MLQALIDRALHPFKAPLFCVFPALVWSLGGCTNQLEGQRPREEALDLAVEFALGSFQQNSNRLVSATDLRIVGERYQQSDHAWYFELVTLDARCRIDVAVPDHDPVESAGGGGCNTEQQ